MRLTNHWVKRFVLLYFFLSYCFCNQYLLYAEDSVEAEVLVLKNRFYAKKVLKLIRNASKNIRLVLSECEYSDSKKIISNILLEELVLQAKRGVRVEVILERGEGLEFGKKNVLAWNYLSKNGMKLYPDSKKFMSRVNFLVVDDFTSVVGSLTWTEKSFAENRELELWLESKDFATKMIDVFDSLKIYQYE